MRFSPIAALLLTIVASPALALDFGNGFFVTGTAVLEYVNSDSSVGEIFGHADVDLGYEQAGGGFGAFVGFEALSYESDSYDAVFGALTYSGSFGKVQIGAPRNALDDYLRSPGTGGIHALEQLEIRPFVGSIVPAYAFQLDDSPLGVRYDGTFGAFAFGVSYHSFDVGAVDLEFIDAAFNVSLGNTVLIAGIEKVAVSTLDFTSYFLGAEATIDQFVIGAQYSNVEFPAFMSQTEATELYGIYSASEALDITASFLSISNFGSSTEVYGLNAQYDFAQAAFIEAGFLYDPSDSSTNAYSLALGVDF